VQVQFEPGHKHQQEHTDLGEYIDHLADKLAPEHRPVQQVDQ
jgi:hypothetical protein